MDNATIQKAWERGFELMAGPRKCESCGRFDGDSHFAGKRKRAVKVRVVMREGDRVEADNMALVCDLCRPDPRPPRKRKAAVHPGQLEFPLFEPAEFVR